MLTRSILIAAMCALIGPTVQAQEREQREEGRRMGRRERRADDPNREQERQSWRDRMGQFQNATPEQRREMRLDWMTGMAERTYELDESQRSAVRSEIAAMDEERRIAMGPLAKERDRLREQMGQYWRRARERSEGSDDPGSFWRQAAQDPEFAKIRDRMREIEARFPNRWEESMRRIEALLPEEQAKKGRERAEQMLARFGANRNRDANRRGDRGARRGGDRGERFGRGRGENDARRGERFGRRNRDGGRRERAEPRRDRSSERNTERSAPARKLHPWEKYVADFNTLHELTGAQAASAQSILKDVRRRAQLVEKRNESSLAEAGRIQDRTLRFQRLAELNKPIDQLFEELKKRLNGLLTAAQRGKPAS